MSINQTLLQGVTERDMQGIINTYDFKPFYFPTLFPLKKNNSLSWKALEATTGLKVAADVVSRNATIDRKKREGFGKISGEIPKLAISREMNESELYEYQIAVAMAQGSADLQALVEIWANDMDFCWTGVSAKIEALALESVSRGKVSLTQTNNQNVVTEFDVDYQIVAERKTGVGTKWATSASAKPVADLLDRIKFAKSKGVNPKFAFMNQNTFAKMAETEDVIKRSASFASVALGISQTPDLNLVNQMLAKQAIGNGLQIVVIDQDITYEINDKRETKNPFVDDSVLLSESKVLGNTQWMTPIDMSLTGSAAMKVMNGPICLKKFSTEEPVVEVTQGIANAFPAWASSNRALLMDVEHSTFQL